MEPNLTRTMGGRRAAVPTHKLHLATKKPGESAASDFPLAARARGKWQVIREQFDIYSASARLPSTARAQPRAYVVRICGALRRRVLLLRDGGLHPRKVGSGLAGGSCGCARRKKRVWQSAELQTDGRRNKGKKLLFLSLSPERRKGDISIDQPPRRAVHHFNGGL
jgi:hypothetical protein